MSRCWRDVHALQPCMLLQVIALGLLATILVACDPGISITVKNTADVPVLIFVGRTSTAAEMKVLTGETGKGSLLITEPKKMRLRVEARDIRGREGQLLFCRIYTGSDLRNDGHLDVVVIKNQDTCGE